MLHLRAFIDTARMLVSLSPLRVQTTVHAAQDLLSLTQVRVQPLHQIIGLMAYATP